MARPVSGELPTVRKIRLDGPACRTASSMSAVLPMPGRSPDQDGGAGLPVGQAGGDQGLLGVPADEQAAASTGVRSRHDYELSHRPRQMTVLSSPARGSPLVSQDTGGPRLSCSQQMAGSHGRRR